MLKNIFIVLFSFFFFCFSKGQDSLQKSLEKRLVEFSNQRKEDSIKRIELENKFAGIQITSKEKESLLKELKFLKSRDSIVTKRYKDKIDSLRLINKGVPVVPFHDTLFIVYRGVGGFTMKERARSIEEKIIELAKSYDFNKDSIKVSSDENQYLIYSDEDIIASVGLQDALWENTSLDKLSDKYANVIADSIEKHRSDVSLPTLAKGTLYAILLISVVSFLIFLINKGTYWLKLKLFRNKRNILSPFTKKKFKFFNENKQIEYLWFLVGIIRWLIILILIYLAIPILFNFFPSTQGYSAVFLENLLTPLKKIARAVIDYLPNLLTITIIIIIFRLIFKFLDFISEELDSGRLTINGFYKEWTKPTYQIFKVLLLIFIMIVIFPYLPGAKSPIFQGVSVFVGILVTFGSAGALGNIMSGLMLTYTRAFSNGDYVKIGDVTGEIIERNLLVTRIRTIKNEIVSVPNSTVMNSHTTNYSTDSSNKGLIIYTEFALGYNIPIEKVHEVAKKAALKIPEIKKDPAPFVFQLRLDDFYITYQINAFITNAHNQEVIYSNLRKALVLELNEAGIEVLSPHFMAYRDGTEPQFIKKDI
ncbi:MULTISPECIES: mechanosensitive ion channel family protein [Empedobacter]|uniref:Mechanosensitive ion channel family protein n=1 Tax=Empedobacter falsenii TaxID=343874 RepID=A0A7H9DXN7_9FLAO|nr:MULTISPECIES: mechanosensitive ion channel family protein [Empedobacter]QLL59509.1 mechanosensitive ion channel family protein [Empedobacter falsenii]